MGLFKKVVVGSLIVASVSIGIGSYIIYERGYSLNDFGRDLRQVLNGEDIDIDIDFDFDDLGGERKDLIRVSFEENYDLKEERVISLEAKLGDVEISSYEGEEIVLRIEGEVADKYLKDYIKVEQVSDGLMFKLFDQVKNNAIFRKASRDLEIRLMIPKSFEKDLEIKTVEGDIDVSDLTLRTLTLKTVSGEIEVQGGGNNQVYFATVSGDVEMESEIEQITGETVSGDVSIKKTKGFHLDSVSGDLEISLYEDPLKSHGETISGDLAIDIIGTKEISYDFETVSGNITIETMGKEQRGGKSVKNKRLNENIVKGSTISGEISLKN